MCAAANYLCALEGTAAMVPTAAAAAAAAAAEPAGAAGAAGAVVGDPVHG